MSKHLNPLEKEFLIRQYKATRVLKCVTSAEANHISTGAFRSGLSSMMIGAAWKVWLVQNGEIKRCPPGEIDRTEESYKREILKLQVRMNGLKKLCRADDGYWEQGSFV